MEIDRAVSESPRPICLYRHVDHKGKLLGFLEGSSTSTEPPPQLDVRTPPRRIDATCLYRHFDDEGNLLYVGISLSHLQRLGQHKANAYWFDRIKRVEIERFSSRVKAKAAEDKAIVEQKPKCNIAGVLRC
jgi:hypothetical protein